MFNFESLNALGWLGIVLRVLLLVVIVIKPQWFFKYDERLPQLTYFEQFIADEISEWIFMGVRFVIYVIVVWFSTKLLISIGTIY